MKFAFCGLGGLLLVLAVAGCAKRPEQAKLDYTVRAEELAAAGNYAEASLNFRKALQLDQEFGRAHYGLALAETRLNHPLATYNALTHTVRLQPSNHAAKIQLAELCLYSYATDSERPQPLLDQAKRLSEQLLEEKTTRFDGLRLKGAIALQAGDRKAALAALQEAGNLKPGDENITLLLAGSLWSDGRAAEAERLAAAFLAREPASARIVEFLSNLLLQQKRRADAEAVLIRAAAVKPAQVSAMLRLARFYVRSGRANDAVPVLQSILAHEGHRRMAALEVSDVYHELGRTDAAIEALRAGATADMANAVAYRRRIAVLLHESGRTGEARAEIDAVVKANPADSEALAYQATLAAGTGDSTRLNAAIATLEGLAAANAGDWEMKLRLGSLYRLAGDLERARQQLAAAVQVSDAAPAASLSLAEVTLALGEPEEALKQVEQCLRFDSMNRRARLLKAAAFAASGKPDAAESELHRILRVKPNDEDAIVQLGLVRLSQGRVEEAARSLQTAYRAGRCDTRIIEGYRQIYNAQSQRHSLRTFLQAELSANPGCAAARSLTAVLFLEEKDYAKALKEYEFLLTRYPAAAAYKIAAGRVHAAAGDLPKSIELFRAACTGEPRNATAHLLLAGALERIGNTKEAAAAYRKVLALDAANAIALNNLANLIGETGGDVEEAFGLAQRAVQTANVPEFSDTLGVLYLRKSMYDSALHIFRVTVAARPDNPEFRYHLAMALSKKGDTREAARQASIALAKQPNPQLMAKLRSLASETAQ